MLVKAFLLGSLVMPRKNGKKVKPEGGKPTQGNNGTHLSLSLMPHDSGNESHSEEVITYRDHPWTQPRHNLVPFLTTFYVLHGLIKINNLHPIMGSQTAKNIQGGQGA